MERREVANVTAEKRPDSDVNSPKAKVPHRKFYVGTYQFTKMRGHGAYMPSRGYRIVAASVVVPADREVLAIFQSGVGRVSSLWPRRDESLSSLTCAQCCEQLRCMHAGTTRNRNLEANIRLSACPSPRGAMGSQVGPTMASMPFTTVRLPLS